MQYCIAPTHAPANSCVHDMCVSLCALHLCRSMVGVARPKQGRRVSSAGEPSPKKPRCAPEHEFDAAKRDCLVVGLKATMRNLERGLLCAGVVCLSTCPVPLQQHLLTLVAVREVPFVAVHDLSPALAPLLGVSSVAALGFTHMAHTHFSQLLEVLQREAPPVHLPWISASKKQPVDKDSAGGVQESGRGSTPSKSGGRGSTPSKSGGWSSTPSKSGGGGAGLACCPSVSSGPCPVYYEASITKVPTAPNTRKVKKRQRK